MVGKAKADSAVALLAAVQSQHSGGRRAGRGSGEREADGGAGRKRGRRKGHGRCARENASDYEALVKDMGPDVYTTLCARQLKQEAARRSGAVDVIDLTADDSKATHEVQSRARLLDDGDGTVLEAERCASEEGLGLGLEREPPPRASRSVTACAERNGAAPLRFKNCAVMTQPQSAAAAQCCGDPGVCKCAQTDCCRMQDWNPAARVPRSACSSRCGSGASRRSSRTRGPEACGSSSSFYDAYFLPPSESPGGAEDTRRSNGTDSGYQEESGSVRGCGSERGERKPGAAEAEAERHRGGGRRSGARAGGSRKGPSEEEDDTALVPRAHCPEEDCPEEDDLEFHIRQRESGESILKMAEQLADWSYGEDCQPPPPDTLALAATLRAQKTYFGSSQGTLVPSTGSSPVSGASDDTFYSASSVLSPECIPWSLVYATRLDQCTDARVWRSVAASDGGRGGDLDAASDMEVSRRAYRRPWVFTGGGGGGEIGGRYCCRRGGGGGGHGAGGVPRSGGGGGLAALRGVMRGGSRVARRCRGGAATRVRFRPEVSCPPEDDSNERCTRVSREVHPRKLRQNLEALSRSPREDDRRLAQRVRQADRERRADERARQRARERAEREWRLQLRRGLLPITAPPPFWARPPSAGTELHPSASAGDEGLRAEDAFPAYFPLSASASGQRHPALTEAPHVFTEGDAAPDEDTALSGRMPPWMVKGGRTRGGPSLFGAYSASLTTAFRGPDAGADDEMDVVQDLEVATLERKRSAQVFFSPWVRECGGYEEEVEDDAERSAEREAEQPDTDDVRRGR